MTLRIGWFATGRGQGSRNLLRAAMEAIGSGRLDARIQVVFCNRERGEYEPTDRFLDLVESYRLPLVTFSHRRFRRKHDGAMPKPGEALPPWRAAYDREVLRLLEPYPFDVGMLAGYMLIFSQEACDRLTLLNLHPAAPGGPVGMWQEVIWELMRQRAPTSGNHIFRCTPELDRGPAIAYSLFPIRDDATEPLWRELERRGIDTIRAAEGEDHPLFQEIRRRGAARELPLVVETLRALATGALRVDRDGALDAAGNRLARGLDLTEAVEQVIAAQAA